jgi:hypothetical protein
LEISVRPATKTILFGRQSVLQDIIHAITRVVWPGVKGAGRSYSENEK